MLAKGRPEPVYLRIAAILREAIERGDYPPGRQIPSETRLMQEHDVARLTARKAVRVLVAEGLGYGGRNLNCCCFPGRYWRARLAAPLRSTYFWILPVAVLGSSVTNVTPCGALKCASRSRAKAMISSSLACCPSRSTTKA